MSHIIGITGPSGSGKSLLCRYITDEGIPCIDADKLYHSMLTPGSKIINALSDKFGNGVLSEDGSLNRVFLSKEVFGDPDKLELLNATVLPIVIDEIEAVIASLSETNSAVAVDAPTLIESGFHKKCGTVIAVVAPDDLRVKRICERDGISVDRALARIKAQHPSDFYTSVADIVLINDGELHSFSQKAISLAKKIKGSV